MLVPMLGKLNYDQKHYAKTEILNVMKNARYLQSQHTGNLAMPATYQAPYYQPPSNSVPQMYHQGSSMNNISQNSQSLERMQNCVSNCNPNVAFPSPACESELYDLS